MGFVRHYDAQSHTHKGKALRALKEFAPLREGTQLLIRILNKRWLQLGIKLLTPTKRKVSILWMQVTCFLLNYLVD